MCVLFFLSPLYYNKLVIRKSRKGIPIWPEEMAGKGGNPTRGYPYGLRGRPEKEENIMALKNLIGWAKKVEAAPAAACGSACGAAGQPEEKPAACGSACGAADQPEEKPAACGSACGAADQPEEKPAACGSACGAGDK